MPDTNKNINVDTSFVNFIFSIYKGKQMLCCMIIKIHDFTISVLSKMISFCYTVTLSISFLVPCSYLIE